MSTDISPQTPANVSSRHILGRVRIALFFALSASLVICLTFSWMTRDAMAHLPFLKGQGKTPSRADSQKAIVDLRPWQTAEALAPLAVTAEEGVQAREAERLADHEIDQAFASALRQASMRPPPVLAGEALALSKRIAQLQEFVKEDQARVGSATLAPGASASSPANRVQPVPAADDLEMAKAQLGLDSDELADAEQDFARASGDERDRIREELAAHEAEMSTPQSGSRGQVAVLLARQYGTLAGRVEAWINQRSRHQLIQQAMLQAQSDAAALTGQHNALEAQANTAPSSSAGGGEDSAARLARIKLGSQRRQLLSIYDDRIQTQQQLAAVYGKWSAQVLLQHRTLLHLVMQQLALIALILLFVVAGDELVSRLTEWPALDRRRIHTLRNVIKLGLQLFGVLLIVIVIFGVPRQMPTILGLTTAGLTVVLQDFILAFFGWFVLMGQKGIRVGDSVEINGVGGEIIDISMFRTTMLETGNWTDKGHPTGRRVTFINNFAITGQYFNFSTAGQWMWDEISVNVPASDDTYVMIELIHKAILRETEEDARLAEEEWKRAAKKLGLGQFRADPAVNLRPAASGIDILVRYVTRASDRFATRNRLYECVIDVLHVPPTLQHQQEHQLSPV